MEAREKLVRDKILEIIREDGKEPVIRTATSGERNAFILARLEKEFSELLNAENPEDELGELADIHEVALVINVLLDESALSLKERLAEVRLIAEKIAASRGFTDREIEILRKRKAEGRGGFAGWVTSAEVKE